MTVLQWIANFKLFQLERLWLHFPYLKSCFDFIKRTGLHLHLWFHHHKMERSIGNKKNLSL